MRRLLHLDDEPSMGRSLARGLRPDWEITTLEDKAEGLDLLRSGEPFDLVITDLSVESGMDGRGFIRQLRSTDFMLRDRFGRQVARVPVGVLSGTLSEDFAEDVAGVIAKPAELSMLRLVLEQWAGLDRPEVLILDDDPFLPCALRRILGRRGFRVLIHSDKREGLELLRGGRAIDLVITDHNSPGMDGVAFLRELRADPRLSAQPVLMLSGWLQGERAEPVRELGVPLWEKPILDMDAFLACVRELVGASSG